MSAWVSLEGIRQLAAFHRWRVERLCAVLATLDAEALLAPTPGSFRTLGKLLSHAIGAEQVWFERIARARRGESPAPNALPSLPESNSAALAESWLALAQRWVDFTAQLSEADLAQVLSYQNLKGEVFATPLDQMVLHVFNHASYHSGQIVLLYRLLGLDGVATDLIAFTRL